MKQVFSETDDPDQFDRGTSNSRTPPDWHSLELAPVEKSAVDFSMATRDSTETAADIIAFKKPDGIRFKVICNRYRQKYERITTDMGLMFEVDMDVQQLTVDLDKLNRIIECFTDELLGRRGITSIITTGRLQSGDYIVRVSGYIEPRHFNGPRRISNALLSSASRLGMQLSYRSNQNNKIVYEIVVESAV